jgi:hypothetical protein
MKAIPLAILIMGAGAVLPASAQDPGKEEIGKVRTELIFGTNDGVEALGSGVEALSAEDASRLMKSEQIGAKIGKFKNFVRLGSVEQSVLRGYKSWAAPIAGSETIMLTFQPQARVVEEKKVRLDIEFWQKKRMVWRWDPIVEVGKRIYLAGPKWRGGHLIITVELISLK